MKRIIGLMLLSVFAVGIWLPSSASAATSPQIYIQTQRRYGDYDRYRERRRERWMRRQRERAYYGNRTSGYYGNTYNNGYGGSRWVRQTYYRNGRVYTRLVRVYY